MKEAKGNLWTYPADIRVITTNGTIKKNGWAVMGRGCAKEAADRWPELPKLLGHAIMRYGNIPIWLYGDNHDDDHPIIYTLPVKHNWWEEADIRLIRRSTIELTRLIRPDQSVVLPRPGCGNGRLTWKDVKPVIQDILDIRFTVLTY